MHKKSNLIIVALAFLLMLPSAMFAQESDFGNWLIYIGNKKIDSKWNIHNEVQYRNYDVVGDLEQLLLRTGVGYNLSENNHNLLLGYGYISSENYIPETQEKTAINEHRIFQQFISKDQLPLRRMVEKGLQLANTYSLKSMPSTNIVSGSLKQDSSGAFLANIITKLGADTEQEVNQEVKQIAE